MNSPPHWRKFGPAAATAATTKTSKSFPPSSPRLRFPSPSSLSTLQLLMMMLITMANRHCSAAFAFSPVAVSSSRHMRSISGTTGSRNTSSTRRTTGHLHKKHHHQQQQLQCAHHDRRSTDTSFGSSNALHGLMPSSSSTTLRTFSSSFSNYPSSTSTSSSFLTNGNIDHLHRRIRPFSYNQQNRYQFARFGHINRGSQSDTNNDEDTNEVKPTWTYTPYKPPPPPSKNKRRNKHRNDTQKRYYADQKNDDWTVPDKITIPTDKIQLSFTRSSGAGGQNVNKLNTQVTLKFHVSTATWIPSEVRQRILENESNRINGEGYLTVSSQEHRTQGRNRKEVMEKCEELISRNWGRPKVRKMRKGISRRGKERNREQKRMRSQVKQNRRKVDF